ncbi:MAG TPA: anaerobic ribonucleoside-triphosphate reductase [Blastocatellia bacterium]|jgi:ribonucleoside-triphosphate reductase|nr:anaerobic ribonucleoside-triphosphate reductase [Blastocatellia bacterium]
MEPDQFPPNDQANISPDEGGEPEVLVRRSDEDIALFDTQRIIEALIREANIDADLAAQIGLEVREFIQKLGFRTLSSSLIRGLVDAKLLELGLEDAHRSHTRLGVPFYDVDRVIHSSLRETSSQPYGPEGTSLLLAEAIKREYAILNVFSEQIANAHLVGDIHIHGIGAIDRPHSLISAVDYVKQFGITLPQGFASSRPARRVEVLVAHIVKLSAALQGYLAGPVVWDSLNFAIAPFLEGLDDRAIKQLAQTLVFEFSAPAVARGGQIVFSDLHLDWDAPSYMKSRPAIGANGQPGDKSYGEHMSEAHRFLQALLEVYIEGDGSGRAFLTPRLVLHINRHFNEIPGYRSVLEMASRLAVERGGLTIAFDRDDEGSFFRRYGINEEKAVARAETHALRSFQFQIVSLNLPRVGYLAGGKHVQVFEELTRLMETAAQAHLEKRVFLEKLLALGERGPLAALTTRASGAPFVKLNWGTHAISLVGLNELCRAVLQSDLHDSEATMEFALKVLTHLKREAERLSNKHKVRFLLSGQSTEVTAHRLARLDLRFFGETAASVVCGDAASDSAYYTDGVRLSATSEVSVLDRVRTEGVFHEFGFTNAATEIWMGESTPQADDLGRLISLAFYQSSCAGLIFCPEFTICSSCGASARGLHTACPHCGSERVDGLAYAGDRYGHTSSWDAGRLAELKDRLRVTGADM